MIFFETAAVGGASIEGGNPIRNESLAEAIRIDTRLRALWSRHLRFILVPHNPSFFKKISDGLAALDGLVTQLTEGSEATTQRARRLHKRASGRSAR